MSKIANCASRVTMCLVLFMVAFLFASARGQEANNFASQGTKELGGSISYQKFTPVFNGMKGNATTIFSFAPYFGYFVFNGFEIGLNPAEIAVISQSGNRTIQTMVFAAPGYNVKVVDKIYLFIEAKIGYSRKSSNGYNEAGFSWGGRTGVKFALLNGGLLNLSFQYLSVTMNPKEASKRNGFNQVLISVGWTVWF